MANAAENLDSLPGDESLMLEAIGQSFALIEFETDGSIVGANSNFLKLMGYSLDEILGRHHRIFLDAETASSLEYRKFWEELASGQTQTREFKRLTKGGRPVWIRASYMPVRNSAGQVTRIVKLAQDSTKERLKMVDHEGKLSALNRSQAVIEFNMDGTVIEANENFLGVMGYTLPEIAGKHHSMFCDAQYAQSLEYRTFWERLGRGEFQAAEYKRFGKHGREIWIQATYNPVFDIEGKPFKVVKYASDVTADKIRNADFVGQLAAISKSQAVIEFSLDGTILQANENFLKTVGYSLEEIKGKHHSMFCDENVRASSEYRSFWEKLARGEFDANQYRRVGKGGREIWIQASYNPILDLNGRPFKVVKYATDITHIQQTNNAIKEMSEVANLLADSSAVLDRSALEMSANSTRTSEQAMAATHTSETVARGVEQLAYNTEEMQASIKEIARNANESSNMSNATKQQAQSTNLTIQKLGESSREIGNVIKVISSIAQQTNLLALNATIEAARAGDAGRGFAAVANEVKELAKQTAKATEDITNKIGAIQADSTDAVKAISGIAQSIDRLNSIAGAIAASVEEQAATTSEVARVVRESNTGVQGITENVKLVKVASNETNAGASQVQQSAKSLSGLAIRLQDMVKRLQKN